MTRGLLNGLDDLVVTGAAAKIPEHPLPDLALGRVRDLVEQGLGRDNLAGRADSALGPPVLDERLLDGVKPLVVREPLDGRQDRKSTRLNSSHTVISYAVFCL